MELTENWKIRKGCQSTYFIELGNEVGVVAVFTDKAEKTKEVAQLLLAAPDLLEALQEIVPSIKCLRQNKIYKDWLSKAEVAIAKAKPS